MDKPNESIYESLHAAIGRAITMWAMLEIKIDELLLDMLRHEKAEATTQLLRILRFGDIPKSLQSRLKLCNDLGPLFYEGHALSDLKSIIKACGGQYRSRNRLAHGEWVILFFESKPPRIVSRIRRFGTRGPERPFTVKQINGMTAKYRELIQRIDTFTLSHHPDGSPTERLKQFFRNHNENRKNAVLSPTAKENREKHLPFGR